MEKINRASTACGPLAQWAIAQTQYGRILNEISPLREKLGSLESDAVEACQRAAEVNANLIRLERSIQSFRDEYAILIREAEQLKLESSVVQSKALNPLFSFPLID